MRFYALDKHSAHGEKNVLISRVTKPGYEIELRKITSPFELLT